MSHTNGTTATNGRTRPVDPEKPAYALRVFRIEKGMRKYIRTLSDKYGGIFTHYKGRSTYCPGEGCPSNFHTYPKIWKGYAAVEVWEEDRKMWFPWVLEITEHLELDFRGVFSRGQVWQVYRDEAKKAGSPVRAVLQPDVVNLDTLPEAFDYLPVLKAVYHWPGLMPLDIKNPMPPRVIVQPSSGDGPSAYQQTAAGDDGADPEKLKEIYEQARRKAQEKHARKRV